MDSTPRESHSKLPGSMPLRDSKEAPKWFDFSVLIKLVIAIAAAWIPALIAVAAGLPLLAVLVLALIISAGVFRLLAKSELPK